MDKKCDCLCECVVTKGGENGSYLSEWIRNDFNCRRKRDGEI